MGMYRGSVENIEHAPGLTILTMDGGGSIVLGKFSVP